MDLPPGMDGVLPLAANAHARGKTCSRQNAPRPHGGSVAALAAECAFFNDRARRAVPGCFSRSARSARLRASTALQHGAEPAGSRRRCHDPAPSLERRRHAGVRPADTPCLRRTASHGAAVPGGRAIAHVASSDRAGQRSVSPVAWVGSGALAEPRPLFRCIRTDDAQGSGRHRTTASRESPRRA